MGELFLIRELYQFFTKRFVENSTIKLLQRILTAIIFLSFYGIIYIHFVTIQLLIACFKQDHEKCTDQKEMKIIEKYTEQSKSYVYAVIIFFAVNCILIISSSIINVFLYLIGKFEDHQLILPLDENNVYNPGVLFYAIFIYRLAAIVIVTGIGSFTISMFLVLIQHASCQRSIVIWKISKPFKSNRKSVNKTWYFKTPIEEYIWLVDIVNRHRSSIKYVKMLRHVLNELYFITFLLAIILIMFNYVYILQYSELMKSVGDKIESCMYVVGSILPIYMNFHLGQKLLNQSNVMFVELCNIPFYTLSKNSQKLLLFIIARSKKPCFFSIGSVFVSSHEEFATLMRKSLSFAMAYYSLK